MGRISSVDQLPRDILESLQDLLRDPRITQLQATKKINAILRETELDTVSKSAVNRYAMKMEKVGARLVESREMAKMWIGKLGAEPHGEVGKLLNQMIQTLAFETTAHLADGDEVVSPKLLAQLALSVQRLEASATDNLKRDEEIRKQERVRAAEEAAETAATSMTKRGMSKEAIDAIKRDILGISA